MGMNVTTVNRRTQNVTFRHAIKYWKNIFLYLFRFSGDCSRQKGADVQYNIFPRVAIAVVYLVLKLVISSFLSSNFPINDSFIGYDSVLVKLDDRVMGRSRCF